MENLLLIGKFTNISTTKRTSLILYEVVCASTLFPLARAILLYSCLRVIRRAVIFKGDAELAFAQKYYVRI